MMNHHPIFRPIIFLLLAFMPGIVVGHWLAGYWKWAMGGAGLACVAVGWAIYRERPRLFFPLLLFFLLGYISIQPWSAPSFAPNHILNYQGNIKREISGVIESGSVNYSRGRARFVVAVDHLEGMEGPISVKGYIRVTCRGESLPDIHPGDRARFVGKIKKIRNFNNPGGFDYERFMAFKRVYATSWVSSRNLRIIRNEKPSRIFGSIERFRARVGAFIDGEVEDGRAAAVLKALVVGDRQAMDPAVTDAFNRSGMGHLLAISGLHVGIVAGFFFFFFKGLFNRIPVILWNGLSRKSAAFFTIIPVLFYGFLAGMSPSTQRAVVMVCVFLMAFPLEGVGDAANTLALAALVILVIYPPALFSVSFQMSFAAVFAIFWGLSRIGFPASKREKLSVGSGVLFGFLEKLSGFFWVSLFAILGTLPLIMYYFNQVSTVALGANFIFVPLIAMVVLPLGLFSTLLFPMGAEIAGFGFKAAGWVVEFCIRLLTWISEIPFAAFKTVTPSVFEILLYYAALGLIFNHIMVRLQGGGGTAAKKREILALAICVAILWTADISYWVRHRFFDNELRITLADVGQGNAAILELPGGQTMLIDGGGFWDNEVFDVGHRIIAPILWRKKILSVDTVVLTHPNSDHLNGLLYILENFHVGRVWSNRQPEDNMGYENFARIIEEKKIQFPVYEDIHGRHGMGEGEVEVEILYPPVDFLDRAETQKWRDVNANSLVTRITMGKFSFLFPGDISAESESELAALYGKALKATVLVAPHHGSATSSSDRFLDLVAPEVVTICLGWQNRFSFPAPKVMDRYKNLGCKVYRTDIQGALTLVTDGETLRIETVLHDDD